MQNNLIEIQPRTGVFYTLDKQSIFLNSNMLKKHTVDVSGVPGSNFSVVTYDLNDEIVQTILKNGIVPACQIKYGSYSKIESIQSKFLQEKFGAYLANIVLMCLEQN
ncbi:hypothetical protein [Flagellimonas marinaquae]|uniref:hypothetical protein n=1 Tax=Flagellimonas marinaquae TaxID=254955 RepID=UPI002074C69F|nr:hypothetical protein [Allomuricauda aquimarina]USD26600.1 hypothetical protein MJO53_06790 [Allomuricauda aquimarina]